MGNRTIYIIIAVVIVLAILGYAGGWFGSGTPVPATTTPAPATTAPAPATTAPAPATGTTTQ